MQLYDNMQLSVYAPAHLSDGWESLILKWNARYMKIQRVMKNQRGDAGVGMLVIMVVMMLGAWLFSDHDGEHGGGGHHMMNEHDAPHEE